MFTLRNLKRKSQFFNAEGGGAEKFEASRERLTLANMEEQQRKIEEMLGRSRKVQETWTSVQVKDQKLALGDLDREMTIVFTGSPPKARIKWIDLAEVRNMWPNIEWPTPKDISLDRGVADKKLSGQFTDAKFSSTEKGVDIFVQGDRIILSIPWKKPFDFSADLFRDRRDLILSQFAQNNGVSAPIDIPPSTKPKLAKTQPTIGQNSGALSIGEVWSPPVEKQKLSDNDVLDKARQDKLAAVTGLTIAWDNPNAKKLYEEMLRKADAEIQRLEAKIAQAKAAQEYARLFPEQKEVTDMRKTLSDMNKDFRSLLARDARWDKSARKEIQSLFIDIKKLESSITSLERWQSEIARLKWEIKTAQANIEARRGNDTYGTLTQQVKDAKVGITRIEGEMVALRSSSAPILAQYKSWKINVG